MGTAIRLMSGCFIRSLLTRQVNRDAVGAGKLLERQTRVCATGIRLDDIVSLKELRQFSHRRCFVHLI